MRGNKFTVYVPKRDGGRAPKKTSTADRKTAKAMDAMLQNMASRHQWEYIEAIHQGKLSVPRLFEAHASNRLTDLVEKLRDTDLQEFVPAWSDGVKSRISPTSDTAQQYLTKLRSLMPEGQPFYRSRLTAKTLTDWLSKLPVGRSTKRKYHASLSTFCEYLLSCGVIDSNPMRRVKPPKANPPRRESLSLPQIRALVEAHEEPYRTVSALIHGTGIEISVALALKCSDVDRTTKEVRARGTKTASRDRVAAIAGWAWPYIERHMANLLPNAPLFPNTDRWRALDAHKAACKAVGIENYRQHDARHSYAVIAIRAGAQFEAVARQLGHANINQVVNVYGRYRPNRDDMRSWEPVAMEQEARRLRAV
jgi:integrase